MYRAIALAGVLAYWMGIALVPPSSPQSVGQLAADIQLSDDSGGTLRISDYRGQPLLIDAWATWCKPCRDTLPHVQSLHAKYGAKGLKVLAVNLEGRTPDVLRYVKEQGLALPIAFDVSKRFEEMYDVSAIPRTFLIDKKGVLQFIGHPASLDGELIEAFLDGRDVQHVLEGRASYWIGKGGDLDDNSATEAGYYLKALAIDPKNGVAARALGIVYRHQNRFRDGIEVLERAMGFNPEDSAIQDVLTVVLRSAADEHRDKKQFSEAILLLNRAAELDPRSQAIMIELGSVHQDRHDYPTALAMFRKVQSLHSGEPTIQVADVHHRIGKILQAQGDLDEAMQEYKAGASITPVVDADLQAHLYEHAGDLLLDRTKSAEALALFAAGLKLDPASWGLYYSSGKAQLALGNNEAAVEDFIVARRLNPTEESTTTALAMAFERAGMIDQARKLYGQPDATANRSVTQIPSADAGTGWAIPVPPEVELPVASKLQVRINDSLEVEGEVKFGTNGGTVLTFMGRNPTEDGINRVEYALGALREGWLLVKDKVALLSFRPYQKSYAIVAAITEYSTQRNGAVRLPYSVKDGSEVADFLESQGFIVTRLLTPQTTTKQAIESAFAEVAGKVGLQDRLLVYMAGHGITKPVGVGNIKRGYFLPSDGHESKTYSMIPMNDLRDRHAIDIPAKQILFVLDACYSGLAFAAMGGESEPDRSIITLRDLAVRSSQPSRFLFTAGGAGEQSTQINKLQSSFFSHYFLRAIRGEADFRPRDGIITVDELRLWVKDRVIQESTAHGKPQRPHLEGLLQSELGDGEFVFVRR